MFFWKGGPVCRSPNIASLTKADLGVKLPDDLVALASRAFQFLSIQDPHRATLVLNTFLFLQDTGRQAYARAIGAEHR